MTHTRPLSPEASGVSTPRPRRAWRCAAVLAMLALASGANAQSWGGGVFTSAEAFDADRETWHETRVAAQRIFARGAASLEGGVASRNGFSDPFVATDLYASAGERGYGNVRAQWAPEAAGVPQLDLLGEAYVALGGGWEASLGARHLIYDADAATLGLGSVAKYSGNWLVRARGVATLDEAVAVSTSLSARYLFEGIGGLTAPFAEVTIGQGQEPIVSASGVEVRQSWIAGVRLQREVRAGFGISAALGRTWDDTLTRWTGGLGVIARF